MKRNLLFHLFPKRDSLWPWHAEQLARYKSVWNGRRIVVTVLDGRCDDRELVKEKLRGLEAEIFFGPNSDALCETMYFLPLLETLHSEDPEEMTFYAHGKGVTRAGEMRENVRRWCDAMYRLNCGGVDDVDRLMRGGIAAVGAFRFRKPQALAPWNYSGNFWWVNHQALFRRDWRKIEKAFYGVEGYLGRHIQLHESYSLTPDDISPQALYDGYVTEERIRSWE